MTISGILTAILIGAILGVLGRAIAPGKQDIPIWLTVIVGIVAALLNRRGHRGGSAIPRA